MACKSPLVSGGSSTTALAHGPTFGSWVLALANRLKIKTASEALGTQAGAAPGILSFAGYVSVCLRPPSPRRFLLVGGPPHRPLLSSRADRAGQRISPPAPQRSRLFPKSPGSAFQGRGGRECGKTPGRTQNRRASGIGRPLNLKCIRPGRSVSLFHRLSRIPPLNLVLDSSISPPRLTRCSSLLSGLSVRFRPGMLSVRADLGPDSLAVR